MVDRSMENLEEQLRHDRRLGRTRRRKRRMKKLLPLIGILTAAAGIGIVIWSSTHRDAPETEAPAPDSVTAVISFVGDINLNQDMIRAFQIGSDYDFSPLFRRITPRLASTDLTVGNLEGNITEAADVSDHNYPAALLRDLYAAGFDILQTANSYSIQNGISGLTATKQAIQNAGMDALGTWVSPQDREENGVLIRDVNGIRFAFLAFTKGVNNLRLPDGADYCVNLLYRDYDTNYTELDRSAMIAAAEQARAYSPDVIIAMVHWGSEYDHSIAKSQKEAAKLLFENGVNVIIGSHSHYVSTMQLESPEITPFGGNFIAYSLGDFVSAADTSSARNGCVLRLSFLKDGSEVSIQEVQYAPTYSAEPSDSLQTRSYEIMDTLDSIRFYQKEYYDRVSDRLYEQLVASVEKIKELTKLPDSLADR